MLLDPRDPLHRMAIYMGVAILVLIAIFVALGVLQTALE